jgi:RNA polymerase sigma factor (sigma-70 family)
MSQYATDLQHITRQSWPVFLDLIDQDENKAMEQFYDFAVRLLKTSPPRNMSRVPDSDQMEVIHDIFLRCQKNDWRILRMYENRGKPFAKWFMMVARNMIEDWLRARARHIGRTRPIVSNSESEEGIREESLGGKDPSPLRNMIAQEHLAIVQQCISQLCHICQLLLYYRAKGLKPREVARAMGWPPEWNKKVSDDTRYCRQQLERMLLERGLTARDLLRV